jgi:hypothetical protein
MELSLQARRGEAVEAEDLEKFSVCGFQFSVKKKRTSSE